MTRYAKAECSKCHRIMGKNEMTSYETRGEGTVSFGVNTNKTKSIRYYKGRKKTQWICSDCSKTTPADIIALILLAVLLVWLFTL